MVWTAIDSIETVPILVKVVVLVIAAGLLVVAIAGMSNESTRR